MEKNEIKSEALSASQEVTLVIEQFLMENYRFRRNTLNGKVEFATQNESNDVFRPLTKAALNSIVIRAKREQILEKGSPKTEITEYVESEEVPEYNPVQAFLTNLPKWDGQNHVAKTMNCDQMIEMMRKSYPSLSNTIGNKVRLGKTIKALGFKFKEKAHISYYDVVPVKVA